MSEWEYIRETLSARLYDSAAPLLVAIDGRCASGKSTLGERLARFFGAPLFHTDDFYLPFSLRTPQRLALPGGHMEAERLVREVLEPASEGRELTYRPYRAHENAWGEETIIPASKIYFVEGSYSLLPGLETYYGYKIFLTHDETTQRARLLRREGKEKLPVFLEKWIPEEERYFAACDVRSRADAAFDTSDWW